MVEENIKFRPLEAASDWPVIISWVKSSWAHSFRNDNLIALPSEMKHCRLMVAVGYANLPLSYLAYSVFDSYVYIGAYVTDPECRGNGIGFKLWNWVIDNVGRDKTYHLLSVEPMTEKYRTRSGFEYISPVTFLRYTGFVSHEKLGQIISDDKTCNQMAFTIDSNLIGETIENVLEYDCRIRRRNEADFLKVWLKQNLHNTARSVCFKDQNGRSKGYGSVVKGNGFRRLGPLLADNFSIMLLLVEDLIGYDFSNDNNKDCQELQWNVPSTNRFLIEFLEKLEFRNDLVMNRSFTKKPDNDYIPEQIFCLAGQLGAPM